MTTECVTPEMILECFENCAGDLDFGIFQARRLLEQLPNCKPSPATPCQSCEGLAKALESCMGDLIDTIMQHPENCFTRKEAYEYVHKLYGQALAEHRKNMEPTK